MHHISASAPKTLPIRLGAGLLALAAGLIHLAVAPEHFEEAAAYGIFMAVVGAAQLAAGLLLVLWPSRTLVYITMLGSVAVFVVFALAYTLGLPFGPHAGEREPLDPTVILSKAIELGLLLALAFLALQPHRFGAGPSRTGRQPPGATREA